MGIFKTDFSELNELERYIGEYGDKARRSINDVLHADAPPVVKKNIIPLIHDSGRKWRGKISPASRSQPFREEMGNLSLTIKSRPAYGYLYFPDDGSNTRKHAGNQQFMKRGGDESINRIVEMCIKKMTKEE